ncbi:MAG: DUF2177 family protein [Alphaproteobacteria bacterium]|nr:DUF2177 family protein [Alphaproteobacteria bacterium]
MAYLAAYVAAGVVFAVLDLLWLGVVARDFYRQNLAHLLRDPFNTPAAVAFYVFYLAGVLFFAIAPALAAQSLKTAALYGFLLGVLAYGTYDMTNLATLRNWPLGVALVDILWGGLLTAVAATAGAAAARLVSG